jgi:translation elongation factor EF-G
MTPQTPQQPEGLFRESIRIASVGERKYVRYFDGRGHFAHLRLELKPNDGSSVTILRGEELSIPDACWAAAETALSEAAQRGSLCGLPCCAFRIRVIGGTYLARHSYPEAFAIVAGMALEDGLRRAMRVVVEPWCEVVLRTQGQWLETLSRRIHQILGETALTVRTGTSSLELTLSLPVREVLPLKQSFPAEAVQIFSNSSATPRYRPVPQRRLPSLPDQGNFGEWS